MSGEVQPQPIPRCIYLALRQRVGLVIRQRSVIANHPPPPGARGGILANSLLLAGEAHRASPGARLQGRMGTSVSSQPLAAGHLQTKPERWVPGHLSGVPAASASTSLLPLENVSTFSSLLASQCHLSWFLPERSPDPPKGTMPLIS